MSCEHNDFEAHVNVFRLEDCGAFACEIRVHCKECGEPFTFPPMPMGLCSHEARINLDGTELRLPMKPKSQSAFPTFGGMTGFEVRSERGPKQ